MNTHRSSASAKRHTRFCGIDVAKDKHVACILDREAQILVRSRSFQNSAEGYRVLLALLAEAGGARRVLVGMEATGHYWYGLHDHLTRHGYQVAVLNPIQTAQQAKKGIRKCKTDTIDARHIAVLIRNGEHRAALIPSDLGMTCRLLGRQHHALVCQMSRIKQLLWARLHPVWPEYENLFTTAFGSTGRKLLHAAPVPADVRTLGQEVLAELIRKASRGRFGPDRAQQVWDAAAGSIGMQRGLEGMRLCIRSLLTQLEALKPIREQLEEQMAPIAEKLPGYLLTLPGITSVRAVCLFGETDPIQAFQSPSQLVAFAGLDLVVFETGQFVGGRRHLSKRGSPALRRTLWMMTLTAVRKEGELRDFYLRKQREGLHHFAATTATALKLCRHVWRILTDRRDYQPQSPARKP